MGYNKSPFKMAAKSPLAKALKGNQGKLPQALQDAIKAAPESPAKQTKEEASAYMDSLREKRAKKAEKSGDKGRAQRIRSTKDSQDGIKSPVKQTKGKMKKEVKQIDPNKFTKTYNAATGQSNDTYYNPKKAESYKKNAIAKYGSLEKSREAYSKAPKSPAKNYKDGYYGK